MVLYVDTESSVPVYAQVADQVRCAIAYGALVSGDPLPSLRETALRLRINPQTIAKAYRVLEQEGLVTTIHGRGTYVASGLDEPSRQFRQKALRQAVEQMILDARNLGVTREELRRVFEAALEAAADPQDAEEE